MDERAQAIERVYGARYAGFRRAAAAVGDFDAAHDAVQDAFARALAERRRFRGGSLEAWIWKIVLRIPKRTDRIVSTASATRVEIDEDVRREYWSDIRSMPHRRDEPVANR